MLKSVDILIGFSVIMLVVSTGVTIVNQMIISTLNLRGLQLRSGVARLLRYIDHGIDKDSAWVLANLVLKDPIVATSRVIGGFRLASVIQREELTILLMRIAAGEASELEIQGLPETDPPGRPQAGAGSALPREQAVVLASADRQDQLAKIQQAITAQQSVLETERTGWKAFLRRRWNAVRGEAAPAEKRMAILLLRKSICENGLPHLHQKLQEIRAAILKLEQDSPALSTSARSNKAILDCAESDFVARLNSWFDQTIDRVSEAFSTSTLFWTLVASLVIAGLLQLDALSILNRLGVDDTYRTALVQQVANNPALVSHITQSQVDKLNAKAKAAQAREEAVLASASKGDAAARSDLPAATSATEEATKASDVATNQKAVQKALSGVLSTSEIIQIPTYRNFSEYRAGLKTSWLGILLSTALLSLGGPFWYELLKNMLKLRSVLAGKDDENRKERQSTQPDLAKS